MKLFIFSQYFFVCVHSSFSLSCVGVFLLVFHLTALCPGRPPVGRAWILQTRLQWCYLWRAIGSTIGHLPGKRAQLSA